MEIKARGGFIIGVSPQSEAVFDYWIRVPDAGAASPIVNIIPVQILAYQLAVFRKTIRYAEKFREIGYGEMKRLPHIWAGF